jgi:hypothetical protein
MDGKSSQRFDVFISHDHRDNNEWVRQLMDRLRADGFSVISEDPYHFGMRGQMSKARFIILVVDRTSRPWVTLEVALMMAEDFDVKDRILAVSLDPVELLPLRPTLQAFDVYELTDDYSRDRWYKELLHQLKSRPRTDEPTHGLRVSAEVPDWVDEDVAAEAVAEFIGALSEMHRAMGGGGLVVDGMEVESDIPAHA